MSLRLVSCARGRQAGPQGSLDVGRRSRMLLLVAASIVVAVVPYEIWDYIDNLLYLQSSVGGGR